MKTIVASVFALTVLGATLGATAANAAIHIGIGVVPHAHHHRVCEFRHHHRFCFWR